MRSFWSYWSSLPLWCWRSLIFMHHTFASSFWQIIGINFMNSKNVIRTIFVCKITSFDFLMGSRKRIDFQTGLVFLCLISSITEMWTRLLGLKVLIYLTAWFASEVVMCCMLVFAVVCVTSRSWRSFSWRKLKTSLHPRRLRGTSL